MKVAPPFSLVRTNQATRTPIASLAEHSQAYTDGDVAAGETYQYFLSTLENGNVVPKATDLVKVPRDAEVHGLTNELAGLPVFSRLFLYKDAVITTQGKDLNLNFTEIVSDNALLETFPSGKKAPVGQSGRNGSLIRISATRGTGRLRVVANGEDGGDGVDGFSGSLGGPGTPGQAGEWDVHPIWWQTQPNFAASMKRFMIETHQPPDSRIWDERDGQNRPKFVCSKAPTNGSPGSSGGPGTDGGRGGRGGDGASVEINLKEPSDLQVDVSVLGGSGGIGGRGGKGGFGGLGGAPGGLDGGRRCAPASYGPIGHSGTDGRQGIPGPDGIKGVVCVKVGLKMFYDCGRP